MIIKEFGMPYFYGFYESVHLNSDMWIDYEQEDTYLLKERLNTSNKLEVEYIPTSQYYEVVCRAYSEQLIETVNDILWDLWEIEDGFEFVRISCIDSPKYYNYRNDRIFSELCFDGSLIETILNNILLEYKETFENYLKNHFTSYDGFHSFYSNCLDDWINKPIFDWDCNELETLLAVILILNNSEINIKEYLNYLEVDSINYFELIVDNYTLKEFSIPIDIYENLFTLNPTIKNKVKIRGYL